MTGNEVGGRTRQTQQTTHSVALSDQPRSKQTTYRTNQTQHFNIMLHFRKIAMPTPPITRNQHSMADVYLEPAEVLSVLRAAKVKGQREWAMIVTAYKHGMRASEVCNLRVDDLDLKNGSIVVQRLKGSLRTTQAVTEHRGEPLLNELRALREWLREI